jgi:hypothetical protein
MDIKHFIPRHKDDQKVIDELKSLSLEELKPSIPELLKWLQDLHWPIARPIADVLMPFTDSIAINIIEILKTDDGMWKFNVLATLGRKTLDLDLLAEIERIANFPTKDEIVEDVQTEAIAILKGNYK